MLNREIALKLQNEYQKKQDSIYKALNKRKKEIYKKFPEIKTIDDQLSSYSINVIRSIFNKSHDNECIGDMKMKIQALKEKKKLILKSNGYAENYMEPHFFCKDCADTGYIGDKRCHCYKQRLTELCYENSNLSDILKTNNFNYFNYEFYSAEIDESNNMSPRQNIVKILKRINNFIDKFDETDSSLLFYGRSGLGKTFLSHCVAKALLDKNYTVVYFTSADLMDMLRKYKINDDEYTDEHISMIFDSDLLILDDLGTEPQTGFTQQELFNVINKRLLRQKKMIIATNLTLDELMSHYPERIYSRILGNYMHFYFFGDDIRLKKINISV